MYKNRFFSVSVLFLLATVMFSSCADCIEGNGHMSTRTARFTEITAVNLALSADVKLVSDSTGTVRIEGESNLIDKILLEQRGTKLKISADPCFLTSKSITIYIPVKTVSDLQISGSGSIYSERKLAATDLTLGVNGSGDIEIEVEAANILSKINGSGDINLKGTTQRHKIEINGSGDVKAAEFPTGNVSITINGSGDCSVFATTALGIKIRGSGSVYYGGAPDISTDIKGSGSIEKVK